MKINRLALLASLVLAETAPAFSQTTFTPTGVIDMIPTSMSDDASIVVGTGTFGAPNLYYTEASGASVIGDGCGSGVPAISGDGTTIVGCNVNSDGKYNAAEWLGGTSWLDLGTVDGGVACDIFLSGSYGIDHDGSLAVGLVYLPQICKAGAGTWDLINGGPATALPALFGDTTYSRANAVNADGSVIVGWQDQLSGERTAAKWVDGVEELILTASGGFNGEAMAVSADGQTIVGGAYNFSRAAWIWHPGTGVRPIGSRGGDGRFTALDVSDDGKVVVGFLRRLYHGFPSQRGAFIWNEGEGTTTLDVFLSKRGVVVPHGWKLTVASLISADGKTIYGWGFNPDGLVEMFKIGLE
jgi:uncharacterized membrane protein